MQDPGSNETQGDLVSVGVDDPALRDPASVIRVGECVVDFRQSREVSTAWKAALGDVPREARLPPLVHVTGQFEETEGDGRQPGCRPRDPGRGGTEPQERVVRPGGQVDCE